MEFIFRLFDTSDFPPRWACGDWSPGHGWLHVLSDLGVWSAYFAIPLTLSFFLARRKDLPFRYIFLLFAAFILLCGTTHLMEAFLFWWPAYRLAGVIKLLTAVVSWITVFALIQVTPNVLAMRTPDELEREIAARKEAERRLQHVNEELEHRVQERTQELADAVADLRAKQELLSTTLASIGDAVITTDLAGRVTNMNAVAESLTGWTNADAVNQPLGAVFNIVNEETRNKAENPVTRALREGVIERLANHKLLVAKDGTERPIDDSAAPIRCKEGKVVGCVLVFRDITERKRAEAEIRERHDELQVIYETTPVGMSLLDRNLRFVRINDRLAEMNGLPAKDHIGKTIHEVIPKLAEKVEPAFRHILETGEPVIETELVGETPSQPGVTRTWLESWYPMRSAGGEIVGVNAVVLEITERKLLEEKLRQIAAELREADRRKDEFLATLAHELRNPLAPIRNGLQVMKLASGDTGAIEQYRGMMERQIEQMVRLVDDLLDISRISRGKIELRKERVQLKEVVSSAVEASRPFIERLGHELTVSVPDSPVVMEADPTRLAQVFMNLLNNSAKYSNPGGRIWLTAGWQGSDVVVSVRDTGIGIPPDKLDSVFDPFTQVDQSLEKSQGGLGIGLTLAKRLTELHGGQIEAKSEGPGRGAEFVVRIPAAAEVREPQLAGRDATPLPRSSLRILIVDDNRDGAESFSTMLRIMGNETSTAYDGQAAVEAADRVRPDVILLDIGLPKLNGFEACRRIREQPWGKGITLIAVTGWGQEEDRRRSQEAGFDYHLVKPVDPGALIKLLSTIKVSGTFSGEGS